MTDEIVTCACGHRNRIRSVPGKVGMWKCGVCGDVLRRDTVGAEEARSGQDCAICGVQVAQGDKALGKHLWNEHRITPNDYRMKYLGLPPKCSRPGCENPVPRDSSGVWFKCCSASCALEMGEDIPVGR